MYEYIGRSMQTIIELLKAKYDELHGEIVAGETTYSNEEISTMVAEVLS